MATRGRKKTTTARRRSSASRSPASSVTSTLRGYQGQAMKLLDRPATRYIIGGVALAALAPIVMRFFRREEVVDFVRGNVESIRSRIDGVIHSQESELESLN